MKNRVTLSLISHTNVGKTTLARTLLRRDVGQVEDAAHVTLESEAYELIATGTDELRLWDTPGFGDSVRLVRRLRGENSPLGWLLTRVWDRFVDRSLYSSQQAARNVKEEADLVLYLVNAVEDPEHAAYLDAELELLTWIDRPAILILNQLPESSQQTLDRWRRWAARWPVLRDVVALDAFARCWVRESILLGRIGPWLEADRRPAMDRLLAAWRERNLATFDHCCATMTDLILFAAADREPVGPASGRGTIGGAVRTLSGWVSGREAPSRPERQAMKRLAARLNDATHRAMGRMIEAHGLSGRTAREVEQRIRDYLIDGVQVDPATGAVLGGVVSGVLGGLVADILSGGLTFGGGAIVGLILGTIGGGVLARAYHIVRGEREPAVRWSRAFLDQFVRQLLLRYLAVAHFGRGRGAYRDLREREQWVEAVERAASTHAPALGRSIERASAADESSPAPETTASLRCEITAACREALIDLYPDSRGEFAD